MNSIFMAENLDRQIVKGVSWNLIETFSVYLSRFLIGVVLARILFPADFGLIGMTAIFISISDVFVKAGFGQAFIYKKDVTGKDADTVFILNLGTSLIIYLLLFFSAPLIADFFHSEKLVDIIRILSLIIIVNSLNVIQYSIIRREMQFKRKAIITVIASVSSGIVGIMMATNGYGVWSLVTQQLANRIFLCIMFYATSSWRFSFKFSSSVVKELFGFSFWVLCSDFIATIMNNFYRLAMGKVYSAQDLGFYDRGHQFQALIADTFTWIFGMVAFPSFTKVREDIPKLEHLTHNYVKYSTFIIFPLLLILLVVSKPFIILLLTAKWIMVIPLLKIFCLIGILIPINFYISPLLQACGETKLDFLSTMMVSGMRVVNVILFIRFGISWILYGEIIILSLNILVMSIVSIRRIGFNYLSVFRSIRYNIFISGIMLAIGLLIKSLLSGNSLWIEFSVPVVFMIATYILLNIFLQKNLIISLVHKIARK